MLIRRRQFYELAKQKKTLNKRVERSKNLQACGVLALGDIKRGRALNGRSSHFRGKSVKEGEKA